MKRTILSTLLIIISVVSFAQDTPKEDDNTEEKTSWFKKQNLFTGGGLNLGLSSEYTELGASPYFGYSFNKYIDVAASFNYDYISQRDYFDFGDKFRQTVVAPGIFTRIFPVNFLFAEALYEHSFIHGKYYPADGTPSYTTGNPDVNSLLIGAGYASGKQEGSNTYYYLSVMFDVIHSPNSPYVDNFDRVVPVIKAGFNIGLFQGHHHDHYRRHSYSY